MSEDPKTQTKPAEVGTSLDDVLKRRTVTEDEGAAVRDILIGGVVLAAGLTVSIFTFANVLEKGYGVYVLAWGPVLYGAGRCLRGIVRLRSGR